MKTIDDFAALHRADDPLVLFNVWDAGSAAAVAEAGAKAIATGSFSLAGAQGYDDGEGMPFAAVLESVRRIAATIDLPLTVDFETGYAEDEQELARNAAALLDAGAIGCNLEDRLLDSAALREPDAAGATHRGGRGARTVRQRAHRHIPGAVARRCKPRSRRSG